MPERGYIILGNASFHRYSGIEDLAKAEGHEVIWLPTYLPDLNSIERYWAKLKKVHREIAPNPIGLAINPWIWLLNYVLTYQNNAIKEPRK